MNGIQNQLSEEQLSEGFANFSQELFSGLTSGEHARVSLAGEQTQFVRFSQGRVRQSGVVTDASLTINFINAQQSTATFVVPFVTLEQSSAKKSAREILAQLRQQTQGAPADPYFSIPDTAASTHEVHRGRMLDFSEATDALLGHLLSGDDLVGLYAGGKTISALRDSAGMNHWFSSESFFVDYSLWLANGRAVKSAYAGREWNQKEYLSTVTQAREQLAVLRNEARVLKPGNYRVFLAPSATHELLNMFSWGALSEGALQRQTSPLCAVRRGEKQFSPKFSLSENYRLGLSPRFSSMGDVSPELVPLVDNGRFVQGLCSARTAKEYGLQGNGSASESLRTADMGVGELAMAECFGQLGTGLYISDLHYLNWSDLNQGRVTGMTRYGCVWVENGQAVGPIQDMRFDETIFRCFGSELLAVTREAQIIPETSTYGRRALGGARVPGVLLKEFNFTL